LTALTPGGGYLPIRPAMLMECSAARRSPSHRSGTLSGPTFLVGVLSGKLQRVEIGSRSAPCHSRAVAHGVEDLAEAVATEGDELVAHRGADIAQLAAAAKCHPQLHGIVGVSFSQLNCV